jgi:hypothetical protein
MATYAWQRLVGNGVVAAPSGGHLRRGRTFPDVHLQRSRKERRGLRLHAVELAGGGRLAAAGQSRGADERLLLMETNHPLASLFKK